MKFGYYLGAILWAINGILTLYSAVKFTQNPLIHGILTALFLIFATLSCAKAYVYQEIYSALKAKSVRFRAWIYSEILLVIIFLSGALLTFSAIYVRLFGEGLPLFD